MFAIILLTIYLDEASSAITILALFQHVQENKKAVWTKLEFLENKKCNSDKI
jgi:predicted component of type VI protein secretion system